MPQKYSNFPKYAKKPIVSLRPVGSAQVSLDLAPIVSRKPCPHRAGSRFDGVTRQIVVIIFIAFCKFDFTQIRAFVQYLNKLFCSFDVCKTIFNSPYKLVSFVNKKSVYNNYIFFHIIARPAVSAAFNDL